MVQHSMRHTPRLGGRHTTTTAHLVQTMTLLSLNNSELMEKIAGELSKNPALELVEDYRCPTCGTKLLRNIPCQKCSFSQGDFDTDAVVFIAPAKDEYYSSGSYYEESNGDDYSPHHEQLPEYLLGQIASELEVEDRDIAAHILTSLDENGLLAVSKLEIARYHHVPISNIDKILRLIQHCDPLGVGSSSAVEALSVQLEILKESMDIPPHTKEIIENYFDLLTKRKFNVIASELGTSVQLIKIISRFITDNLNPYPARGHWGTVRHQSDPYVQRYHNPDVIISCQGNQENPQLFIEILWPIRGNLRINPEFLEALKSVKIASKEGFKKDIDNANLLIKCLAQRNHTLVRLMEMLADIQRDYILFGNAHLIPYTRAKIATLLGVHEATISRAVSGKSVQLPNNQIVPISQFFDRSLHIRTAMIRIIEEEEAPLSDTKIATRLEEEGYNIARRTVAKYRSMEGILPAHQRG